MFIPLELTIKAQLVLGPNERSILDAASNKIKVPEVTNIGMVKMAKSEVLKLHYGEKHLLMNKSDFYHHKSNLISEMDESIKAALMQ